MANAKFLIYKDKVGEYRWRLVASNGQVTAASAQHFASHYDAKRAAEHVKDPRRDGRHRRRVKLAALGSVSVHSHVGHATAQAAKEAGPEQRLGDLDSTGSASRQRQQEIINIQALRVSGLKDRWVRVDGYVMRGITGAKTIAASTAGLALGYASSEQPRR